MTDTQQFEQVTIKAGELSWEEWQRHLDAMSARDGVTLVYNPGEYVHYSGIQVSIADLFVPHPFPITFQQDFTYTPVYPATQGSSWGHEKPTLYKGRLFRTWEELDDVVEAYKLTDENAAYCFEDGGLLCMETSVTWINKRDEDFPLPWTLVKMPDVEDAPSETAPLPYKFAVFPKDADCFEEDPDRLEETFEEAVKVAQAECYGTGNDMNIVVATFRAEHHTNVNERTF